MTNICQIDVLEKFSWIYLFGFIHCIPSYAEIWLAQSEGRVTHKRQQQCRAMVGIITCILP